MWIRDQSRRHLQSPQFKEIVLCAVIIGTTFGSTPLLAEPVHPNRAAIQQIDQSDLLWWLPTDTESVVVARGPFLFPTGTNALSENSNEKSFTARATLPEIHSAFEALPLEIVDAANLIETFKGSVVEFALQGTRYFREPSHGSEVTGYEGCSIVVFQKAIDGIEPRLRKARGWEHPEMDSIGGVRVLLVQDKSDGADEVYLIAFPLPNVLLVANDRGYLRDVLDRIKQRSSLRALPDELPEWRLLPRAARFWGLRHYDPRQARMDPTSPLGEDSAYVQNDPMAVGALFALDPKDGRSLMVEYLSRDEAKARAEAAKGKVVDEPQEGVKYELKLRNPSPGVFEAIYPLDKSSTLGYGILAIEFALGRGMNF